MASRIGSLTDFAPLAPPWLLTELDQNTTNIAAAFNDSSLGYVNAIATDTGTINAYAVTLPYGSPTGYNQGFTVAFIPANTNTGASTIAVSPLGTASITDINGNALAGGIIVAAKLCLITFVGTSFRLLNQAATGGVPYYYAYDDFIGNPTFLTPYYSAGIAGGNTGPYTTQIVGHPGNWKIQGGTNASAFGGIGTFPTTSGFTPSDTPYGQVFANSGLFLDTFTITLRSLCQVNTFSSGNTDIFFGLYDNPVGPISASHNAIGFAANVSRFTSSNWQVITSNGTTQTATATSTTVSIGTNIDLMLVITASSVGFYINQTLVNTSTTNIPLSTVNLFPNWFCFTSSGAGLSVVLIDTFELLVQIGTPKHFLFGPV